MNASIKFKTAESHGHHFSTFLSKLVVFTALLLMPLLVVTGPDPGSGSYAYAEQPPGTGGGKPDDPPGSGGKGPPDQPPGGGGGKPDKPGRGSGDIYSELVIAYRTEDGLPILVAVPEGLEEGEPAALALPSGYVACVQPIMTEIPASEDDFLDDYAGYALDPTASPSYDPLGNPLFNWADAKSVSPVPLGGTGVAGEECDVVVPGQPGNAPKDYNVYVEEVHFGRMNSGRSPNKVLDAQLEEAYREMTIVGAVIDRDHAGRITVDDPGTTLSPDKTIDSPLQNLAIYRELLTHQQLSHGVTLPNKWGNDTQPGFLDWAAAALGASAEKDDYWVDGPISLDLVVYFNRILGIPDSSSGYAIEGDGAIGAMDEVYFDYSGFDYVRSDKYPGCAVYQIIGGRVEKDTIMHAVFPDPDDPAALGGEDVVRDNVFGFATAADDSRRVIAYKHDITAGSIVMLIDKAGEEFVCEEAVPWWYE